MRILARILTALTLSLVLLVPLSAYAALIDINTADAATLDTLPGIGPTKAAAIVAYRKTHGPFASIADIQDVSGIGPVTYAKLEPLITVRPAPVAQPMATPARSQGVQEVDTAESNNFNATVRTESVPPESGALGAAAALAPEATGSPTAQDPVATPAARPASEAGGFLHSTWAIGLLVILAFAGGAFMIL
jgi:competence ComEA-like helix-hairpin-helix protein